ncbi:hypothetical protein HOE04_03930 [archaeon]|jgi:hypothetical protein|nr:hypothetical protein [archaeon]
MVSRYGERLQELEQEIVGKLNELGVINLKFYFPDNPGPEDKPYLRYKIVKPFEDCRGFRQKITSLIVKNFSGKIKTLNWGRDSESLKKEHKVYLEMCDVHIENPSSMNHGLLNLINQELRSYKMRK